MGINLGTATPSDYKLGTASVSKVYLGTTQVWPVVASTKLTIARNNGSTASFSGTGISTAPYARASAVYFNESDGMVRYTFTLTASGTVYMSCNCADETDSGQTFSYKKNGTAFATSSNGGQTVFSGSTTGNSGDVFTLVANASSGDWASQYVASVSVYAT